MLDRLNDAMEYVERHLDQSIDVAELARIALTSEYHLRRLFSALAGMPLSEYVRRRRLTVAGADVLSGRGTLVVEGSTTMRYRIVHKDGFTVVGRKARVPLVHEGMNPAIVAFVRGLGQQTRDRIAALSDQEPAGAVGIGVNLP